MPNIRESKTALDFHPRNQFDVIILDSVRYLDDSNNMQIYRIKMKKVKNNRDSILPMWGKTMLADNTRSKNVLGIQ